MFKRLSSLLIVVILCTLPSLSVFASSINLTDKLQGNTGSTTQQVTQEPTVQEVPQVNKFDKLRQSNNDFIVSFGNMFDGVTTSERSLEIIQKFVNIVMLLTRYIFIGVIGFFLITFGLDLMFLTIPFSRKLLSNGHTGNANTGIQSNNGSNNGGFGIGMQSGGGFGGFGGNSFGSTTAGTPNGDVGTRGNRIQLVSTPALNAVASEGNVDSNGTPISRYKYWLNDKLVTIVIVGIGFSLIITGMLTKLTLLIGTIVTNLLANLLG